jgi:hypothetical protein
MDDRKAAETDKIKGKRAVSSRTGNTPNRRGTVRGRRGRKGEWIDCMDCTTARRAER